MNGCKIRHACMLKVGVVPMIVPKALTLSYTLDVIFLTGPCSQGNVCKIKLN